MSQVWRSQLDRDHPDTIKRRFVSAAFMTIVSPVILTFDWSRLITWPKYWLLIGSGVCLEIRCWTFVRKVHAHGSHRPQNSRYVTFTVSILILSFYHKLTLIVNVFAGLIQASVLPLLLTMILFLGPTAMLLLDVSARVELLDNKSVLICCRKDSGYSVFQCSGSSLFRYFIALKECFLFSFSGLDLVEKSCCRTIQWRVYV